jgi:hypothetical protein
MKTKDMRYYDIIKEYTKICGKKKPYKAKYRLCKCHCGNEFNVRSERWKSVIACKSCTYTIKTKQSKGGLFLTIPNFSFLKRKYNGYKKRAKVKMLEFKLTIKQALELFESNCYYCNIEPQEIDAIYNGNTVDGICKANTIDRLDSNKGYTLDNVVASCNTCNKAKLSMTEQEFIEWITRVYNYKIKKSSTTIPHEGSTP